MFDINVNRIQNEDLIKTTRYNYKKENLKQASPNAFYMAVVVDTNDIENLGRIKARIPAIHGVTSAEACYLPDNDIPWARPAIFAGAGNDMGQFIVPTKGSIVFMTFEFDDFSKPIYFGGVPMLYSGTPKTYNDNAQIYSGDNIKITTKDRITDMEQYCSSAKQVIYKSLKGSTIYIDDKDGGECITIIDAAGQQIIMENNNNKPLDRRGNSTEPKSTANIKIISAGKVSKDCDTFELKCNKSNINDYVEK